MILFIILTLHNELIKLTQQELDLFINVDLTLKRKYLTKPLGLYTLT